MPVPTPTGLWFIWESGRISSWPAKATGRATLNLIALALATARVPWWAEVRCHSGIDHGDGASSPGSCMESSWRRGRWHAKIRPATGPLSLGLSPGLGPRPRRCCVLGCRRCRTSSRGFQGPGLRARQPERAHGGQRHSGRWLRPSPLGLSAGRGSGAHGACGPARCRQVVLATSAAFVINLAAEQPPADTRRMPIAPVPTTESLRLALVARDCHASLRASAHIRA